MHRAGFTAVELIVVLGLMSLMAGVATTSVVDAARRSTVNDAVSAIEEAVHHARSLARGHYNRSPGSGRSLPNYAVEIDGRGTSPGVRVSYEGTAVFERSFGPHVQVLVDGAPLTGRMHVYFASGTGFTSDQAAGRGQRTTLGVDEALVIATLDEHIAYGCAIHEVGMVSIAEVTP